MKKKKNLKAENFAMKAELLANDSILGSNSDLPDEIENQFLKNVIAFERAPYVKVKTLVPEFPPEKELTDQELKMEFERLIGELAARHIQYGLCKKLPMRIAYTLGGGGRCLPPRSRRPYSTFDLTVPVSSTGR